MMLSLGGTVVRSVKIEQNSLIDSYISSGVHRCDFASSHFRYPYCPLALS